MRINARTSAAALAAATAMLAAGCGSGSNGTAGSPTATASPSGGGPATTAPTASGTVAPSASPSSTGGSQAQGPGRCHTAMLSAHVTLGSPGAGQRYAFLVLTNIAGVTCQVLGYPGMQLANAAGPIVTRVSRVAATPQLLTVTQGQHVYSQLHWTVVPATSETSNPCEPVPTVLHVTPPDETTTLSTSWPGGSVCQQGAIDVTPFKPGTGP